MVDIRTAFAMDTNCYAMSLLVSLPANHAKHKMPRPFNKLYYLGLALPNDDSSELVSPTTSKHIWFQLTLLPSTITSTFNFRQCSSSTLASRYYCEKMAIRTCLSNRHPSRSLAPPHTLLAQKSGRWWTLSVPFYSNVHYQGSGISVFLAAGNVLTIRPLVSKFCAISQCPELICHHCVQVSTPHTGSCIQKIHVLV